MELIVWSDEYTLGVPSIDAQHKKLVALINRVNDLVQAGPSDRSVGSVLVDMVDYAKVHFQTEEGIFRAHGFPDLEKHQLIHQYFVNRVKVFANGFLSGDPKVAEEMLSFLKMWLVDHICNADRGFADFLRSRGETV